MVTYNLSSIRSLNLMYMRELNLAQAEAQQTIKREKRFFDFNLKTKKTYVSKERVEGLIVVEVPYSNLWFKADEEKLRTILDLKLELFDLNSH